MLGIGKVMKEVTEVSNKETDIIDNETVEEVVQQEEVVTDNEPTSDEAASTTDQSGDADDVLSAKEANLVKQLEAEQQRTLRVQADYDNFRRRTVKEKEELARYASVKLVEQLLPVLDNFERAITAAASNNDYDSLAKGVDMIFRQMAQTMEQEGLKAMETVGQPFNPEYHQAIMQVESDEYEDGIVVEEVQKGYMLKDKVLRPAMVKVSG